MTSKPTGRVQKLDSVRGIAALMVLVGHSIGLSTPAALRSWPDQSYFGVVQILWDGVDAVVIFFLLSGYVLALQLSSPRSPTTTGFIVRRVFRIWPAFAVAIILSFLLLLVIDHAGLWDRLPPEIEAPSLRVLVLNLLMAAHYHAIDPPVWSLFVEMRMSLIFPIIAFFALRGNFYAVCAISIVASVALSRFHGEELGPLITDIARTSGYLCLFVIGAALTRKENPIQALYLKSKPWMRSLVAALAVISIAYRFLPLPLPAKNYVPWIGVTLLFVFCLYSGIAVKILERKSLLFLGRISYGLYLIHFPILYGLMCVWPNAMPWWMIIPSVIILSVIGAVALNVFVENPMNALGQRLSPAAARDKTAKQPVLSA